MFKMSRLKYAAGTFIADIDAAGIAAAQFGTEPGTYKFSNPLFPGTPAVTGVFRENAGDDYTTEVLILGGETFIVGKYGKTGAPVNVDTRPAQNALLKALTPAG